MTRRRGFGKALVLIAGGLGLSALPLLCGDFYTTTGGGLPGVVVTNTPSGSGQCLASTSTTAAGWGSCGSGNLPSIPASGGEFLNENGTSATWATASGDWSCSTTTPGDCTVSGLHFGSSGLALNSTAPTAGQFLVYDGTHISGHAIAASDLPATAVNSVVNDTNVTGSIASQVLTIGWTGTLAAGRGGTGVDASAAANGALLIGNGSGYTLANLTAGAGVTITNGAGSITIAAGGGSSTPATELLPPGGCSQSTEAPPAANASVLQTLIITQQTKISNLVYDIGTADTTPTDYYDIGVYGPCTSGQTNCPLVFDLGSGTQGINLATTGNQVTALHQGSVTIQPGAYAAAFTGTATTAKLTFCTQSTSMLGLWPYNVSGPTTTSGQLPSSITMPTFSPTMTAGQALYIGGY